MYYLLLVYGELVMCLPSRSYGAAVIYSDLPAKLRPK